LYAFVCSIQQSAAIALGRLANHSDELAEALVQNGILPQLVCLSHFAAMSFALHACCIGAN